MGMHANEAMPWSTLSSNFTLVNLGGARHTLHPFLLASSLSLFGLYTTESQATIFVSHSDIRDVTYLVYLRVAEAAECLINDLIQTLVA